MIGRGNEMSWIRKIYTKLTNDEEVIQQKESKHNNDKNHPRMNTKVTYRYPKTPFRFPLTVKGSEKTNVLSRKKRPEKTAVQSEAHMREIDEVEHMEIHEKKQTNRKHQKPFTPTDIPSPIYGFQPRPSKMKTTVPHYEIEEDFIDDVPKLQIHSHMNDADSIGPIVSAEEDEASTTIDVDSLFNEIETYEMELELNEQTAESDLAYIDEMVEEESNMFQKDLTGEEEVYDSQQKTVEISEQDEVNDNDEALIIEPAELKQKDLQEIDHQRNTHSPMPFNVLMLKSDRVKWQKKQKLKEQSVPDIVEKQGSNTVRNHDLKTEMHDENYQFPPLHLLTPPQVMDEDEEWLQEQSLLLNETLKNFNVNAHVVNVNQGPAVTRFEVQPAPGVKVSRITNLSDDIKLSMAAKDIRIEAPIPGKRSVGIELPNQASRPVQISEILGDGTFQGYDSPLTAALGLDISGLPVVTDLRKMPHGLIAGATGSGKSVCINSILVSLLYKAKPEELKLLLIDPKMVELAPYNHIPHLLSPVITDVKAATAALKWTVDEMERRYELFAHGNVRDIHRYNQIAKEKGKLNEVLPYIVVVIDELADLMMMAPADVEESICRIAQKARACGIHLLIATQRPSVDVITGLIKANIPTRIAFAVSSQVDSRTIIDISGAEKLLGRGDMLFLDSGSSKPTRIQGTFVSDQEIDKVIEHVRMQGEPHYLFEQDELLKKAQIQEDEDELFTEACEFIVEHGTASTSLLQRHFRIGYNRAARLIFMMEERGFISEARGSKARDVLIGEQDLNELKENTLF